MLDLLASLHAISRQSTHNLLPEQFTCRRDDGNSRVGAVKAHRHCRHSWPWFAAVLCTNAGAQVRFGSVVGTVADAEREPTVAGATVS